MKSLPQKRKAFSLKTDYRNYNKYVKNCLYNFYCWNYNIHNDQKKLHEVQGSIPLKKFFGSAYGAVAILLALLIFASVAVSAPYFIGNGADKPEKNPKSNKKETTAEQTTEEATTDLSQYYFSEGYEVLGGDLFCEHNWQDWFMTRAATLTSIGSELRYCNRCLAHQTREFGTLHGIGERALLDVKCMFQMPNYPNGCEVVSLTMVLNYLGYDVTTDELIDNHMPRGVFGSYGDNPFYKYLGDPRGLGVGCYAPAIVTTADNYFSSIGEFRAVTDVSGRGFEDYKSFITRGTPVIFWGTTYMNCNSEIFGTVYINDEEEVIWRNYSHCFVLIGYTDTTYIFCDPLRGIIEYPKEDVEQSHSLVYEQACIIQ
ncbi:MAG: hypothetical protein E7647_06285 [Ruminococcaceae bacterium]|nr:hypothetical protein [Oscillospiraceae bacterium]